MEGTMAKKGLWLVIPALLWAAGSVCGEDFSLSAGAGGLVGGLFTRYSLNAGGEAFIPVDLRSSQRIDQFNYGGFLFADAVWAELSLSLQNGRNAWEERYSVTGSDDGMSITDDLTRGTGMETMFGLGLLGKYPFRLNKGLRIFPLAGLEYQIALMEYRDPETGSRYNRTDGIREPDSGGRAYKLPAWNSLFVDIGAGLDIDLRPGLFLRTELLYGFRLRTPFEKDALEKVKNQANAPNPALKGLTSGPTLKLALGIRFPRRGRAGEDG
jgi:hypothetical protein